MTASNGIAGGVGLLPCPFCGELPDIEGDHAYGASRHPDYDNDANHSVFEVRCFNEDCPAEPRVTDYPLAQAIAAWNTRLAAPAEVDARVEAIVPPENGEPDPEWRAIRRAIDQFAGRVPTISKHRAVHNEHLRQLVERLDAAGDREAADTIVWQAWFRALDRERERFLLADAALSAQPTGGE